MLFCFIVKFFLFLVTEMAVHKSQKCLPLISSLKVRGYLWWVSFLFLIGLFLPALYWVGLVLAGKLAGKLFRQNFSEFDISNAVFEKVGENRLPVYRKGPAKTGTWISAFHTKIVARRLFIRCSECWRDHFICCSREWRDTGVEIPSRSTFFRRLNSVNITITWKS